MGAFNPYKILGVGKLATEEQIKSRFRLVAKKKHPDHNGGQGGEEFREVLRAYELLLDPLKRKLYDTQGLTEDDPMYKRQLQAVAVLQQMFVSLVSGLPPDKLEELDLIGHLRGQIREKRAELNKELTNLRAHRDQQVKTLRVMKKRLKRKKNKESNFFIDALVAGLEALPARILKIEQSVEVGDDMVKILEDFDYEFTAPRTLYQPNVAYVTVGGWR